ncbi:TadE/TadG family type IV pilus assembly protein [candidate division CSSED10-310 bacterium]|uniref:TadE/TadG family type IV pilus assembly protein n=1 Tax=candidate division CSSED10-310 bacterium TaxID=2855610 RepID=A0ABV6Z0H2_UNCC1
MKDYIAKIFKELRSDKDGQSMVFIALILFTMVCFIAITINVGVFISHKIHNQGIADAAALSGAVWQARGLNLIKLMNQMINVALTHVAAELAQMVYWQIRCDACIAEYEWAFAICFLPTMDCWNWIEETVDLINEQSAVKDHIDHLYSMERMIGEDAVPWTAVAAIEYNYYRTNDADPMFPYLNFFAGSGDFSDSTTGGWQYYFLPTLAIKEEYHWFHVALWRAYSQVKLAYDEDYPDKQWIATLSRYEYRPEIMFDAEYNPDGYGYWALAQARPFGDDPDLAISWFDTLESCDWDAKLMPFTADNQLASHLGTVPSWLITGASDLFILH